MNFFTGSQASNSAHLKAKVIIAQLLPDSASNTHEELYSQSSSYAVGEGHILVEDTPKTSTSNAQKDDSLMEIDILLEESNKDDALSQDSDVLCDIAHEKETDILLN